MRFLSVLITMLLLGGMTRVLAAGAEKGEPAPGKLPEEANRLRQNFWEAAEHAVQPVRERYVADLKRLLEQYTRAGRLDDALAVKAELEASAHEGVESAADFERRLVGIKWMWNGGFEVEFRADGTGTAFGLKWKTVRPYTVTYTFSNGNHGTVVFERNLSRAAAEEVNNGGKKYSLTLTRAKE